MRGARVRAALALAAAVLPGAALAQEIEVPRPPGRAPIEVRAKLEPASVELSIVEIRPALRATTGAYPIEVVVKNGGSQAVHVRPVALVVSDGIGRIAHGSAAPVEPGGVAGLDLDLPVGDGRCGERLTRRVWLQVLADSPVPGYRSGNAAGSPWSDHRDRNPEDDRREVAIRIDCALEVLR